MLLVLVAVVAWRPATTARFDGPLDPRNPEPRRCPGGGAGARRARCRCRVARGEAALFDPTVDAGTSVVVTNPDELGRSTLDSSASTPRSAGALVLVGPGRPSSSASSRSTPGRSRPGDRSADCDAPWSAGSRTHLWRGGPAGAAGCFADGLLLRARRATTSGCSTSPDSISNAHVLDADNAALALRLLGQHDRLVWYVADSADTRPRRRGPHLLAAPPLALPVAVAAAHRACSASCSGAAGGSVPLVTEPLPVVVRAAESTREPRPDLPPHPGPRPRRRDPRGGDPARLAEHARAAAGAADGGARAGRRRPAPGATRASARPAGRPTGSQRLRRWPTSAAPAPTRNEVRITMTTSRPHRRTVLPGEAREALRRRTHRGGQGRRRPGRRRLRAAGRAAHARARAARGRARRGEDAAGPHAARSARRWTPSGCSSPPT